MDYEETREDIEASLGIVPGFLDGLNDQDLVNEWPIFKRTTPEATHIPATYRELMGLAIAANLECPYCQLFHREAATLDGATEAELAEAAYLASGTARYSAILHGQHYDSPTFEGDVKQIGEHLEAESIAD